MRVRAKSRIRRGRRTRRYREYTLDMVSIVVNLKATWGERLRGRTHSAHEATSQQNAIIHPRMGSMPDHCWSSSLWSNLWPPLHAPLYTSHLSSRSQPWAAGLPAISLQSITIPVEPRYSESEPARKRPRQEGIPTLAAPPS